MGMEKKQWIQILNHIEAEWEEGTESTARGKLNEAWEREYPEQGYIVVKKFREAEHPCEWCGESTLSIKTYKFDYCKNVWKGKCRDNHCHAAKEFTPQELNNLIEKTHINSIKKAV